MAFELIENRYILEEEQKQADDCRNWRHLKRLESERAMAWCHCHATKNFVMDEWLLHSQGILNTSAHDAHATYAPIADAVTVQEYISARTAFQITSLRWNHILIPISNEGSISKFFFKSNPLFLYWNSIPNLVFPSLKTKFLLI